MDQLASILPVLLAIAWLLPLASFTIIVLSGRLLGRGLLASYIATGAILGSLTVSLIAFFLWLGTHGVPVVDHHHGEHHVEAEAPADFVTLPDEAVDDASSASPLRLTSFLADAEHGDAEHHDDHGHAAAHAGVPTHYAGNWYELGVFGPLRIEIGYYVDVLTVCMFVMVSLIASCIHFYSIGYMSEELDDEVVDHECVLPGGKHLHRQGRFYRFFQYLSLFCFSMFGLVIAGNLAMVFVFWELVGICSYLLIGFYRERKSASTAANKAFIVNRVGDFGMLIGLMAVWGSLGTFTFADVGDRPGIFSLVRPPDGEHQLIVPDRMVKTAAYDQIAAGVEPTTEQIDRWRSENLGYGLLVVAGLGVFCGCIGKSAQFPLHVWLPDAMEGPTPVSALIHAATMVAAGVYLVGRAYPLFTPEVSLVIAYVGTITLALAAVIAITATDIKRVLAYSTVSQLGYMMMALGIGGWVAGLFHLFTHAFFKALLFLCSGSVIHACHTNEMPQMGGLRKKMPWTAYTMLIGCLAIAGAGIPFLIGLSGFHSKDSIIAQAMSFAHANPSHAHIFYIAAGGAAVTAFYMFRLWYMTFAGEPRDHHIYEHAHESPRIMYVPLVILAVFAVCVAWRVPFTNVSLNNLLENARPAGAHGIGALWGVLNIPHESISHEAVFHNPATWVAFFTALFGFVMATLFYGVRVLDPAEVKEQFSRIYRVMLNKFYFDEIYAALFVRPTLFISQRVADLDKKLIDGLINRLASGTVWLARVDEVFDRVVVDGLVNVLADWTYAIGLSLRSVQTGRLRQYVMFIVVGTVGLFVLISFFWNYATAAGG